MSKLQNLLNIDAELGNTRHELHITIKHMRGTTSPVCWGMDDCSTNMLSQCPWRIDCDSIEAATWQETKQDGNFS